MTLETNCSQLACFTLFRNSDKSKAGGDNLKGSNPESNASSDSSSQKSHRKPLDWREFRASLYIQEQVLSFFPEFLL
ncbi:UPF0301 TC_0483 isoform X1 [Olea europaea subsp. europaea]|uniref:UPF0301 TC_0483 isoform X1 n=1 Tax=Olea europaea subsp. europaea TaxID=158383 RepID=A0A8S0QJU5_OLEEU|nr:UPF0301 TC_0483 isoform X1 [Olea europaea subsp. europaea]